jgi:predicted MPP superfamily phosphohydrolase
MPLLAGWTPARLIQRWPNYLSGWIDGFVQPGNRLYVNRGIGFSYIPVRFGAPPELTLVTLRSSPPGRP